MAPVSHFDFEADRHRYETLLELADLVARPQSVTDLMRGVSERLRQAIPFQLLTCAFHDPSRNTMKVRYCENDGASVKDFYDVPADDAPCGWVWQTQEPLVIHDIAAETRFRQGCSIIRETGVRTYCCIPLTTAMKRLGALGIGCTESPVCNESDLRFMQRVAELVALAIENATNGEALNAEKERLQMLLEVSTALLSHRELSELFTAISASIRKVVKQDYASLHLHDEENQVLRRYATDRIPPASRDTIAEELSLTDSAPGLAFLHRETRVFRRDELKVLHPSLLDNVDGVLALCSIPLVSRRGALGTLNFASKEESAFSPQNQNLLNQIAGQIAAALDNARAYHEIAALKDKLSEEKVYLQGEIRSQTNFGEIIGESPALGRVLDQAKIAAPSDATVLLLGETGTGKELVARAIHRMSRRQEAPFVKMNCAAIPTGLLESELFGHEKGAFTGAISRKVGRLELADKGTLFLDEVGDIPLELQPKLLRVLQDQEFERLGSTRTIRVNIRLIAATNNDLVAAVAQKQFRGDLYYRLNVFPVRIPPLRERREDIPGLVHYFLQQFARRMNRRIEVIPDSVMEVLHDWSWPGNVRELENFIERSVILSRGEVLNVPVAELAAGKAQLDENQTLENLEREHIVRVLRETRGVIAGPRGAAARLGLKRTTLQSRIQRMGISTKEFRS